MHLVQSMKGVIRSGYKEMRENRRGAVLEGKAKMSKDKVVTTYLRVRANNTLSTFPTQATR